VLNQNRWKINTKEDGSSYNSNVPSLVVFQTGSYIMRILQKFMDFIFTLHDRR
jgi:hypothetical protein